MTTYEQGNKKTIWPLHAYKGIRPPHLIIIVAIFRKMGYQTRQYKQLKAGLPFIIIFLEFIVFPKITVVNQAKQIYWEPVM